MAYGFTYTLPTLSAVHGALVVCIKTADFPSAALNGANEITNGGGNLIAYTNSSKTTQLPIDIVYLVTGGSATAKVYVRITPTATTGQTIYLEADDVQTVQPSYGSTYGRGNVWQDSDDTYDGDDLTYNRATNVTDGTEINSPASGSGSLGNYTDFDGVDQYIRIGTLGVKTNSTFTIVSKVNSAHPTNQGHLYSHGDFSNSARVYLGYTDSSTPLIRVGSGTNIEGTTNIVGSNSHLALNISSGNAGLYLNGSEELPSSPYTGTAGSNVANRTSLGAFWNSNGSPTSNNFSDAEIYFADVSSSVKSASLLSDESDNMLSTAAWGTVGAWTDSGGGGFQSAWAVNCNQLI